MMNGSDIKKAAINKAKQVAQAANGNGGKKRRKGQARRSVCVLASRTYTDWVRRI
jgi:serine/threonine-protein kinase SRPK3